MSTSPIVSTETPSIPRRLSRRVWILTIAAMLVGICTWIVYIVSDSRVRANQSAQQNAEVMRLVSPSNGFNQTNPGPFVGPPLVDNLKARQVYAPYTANTQLNTGLAQQNNLQYRMPTTVYYVDPVQSQDPAENVATNEINQLRNQLRTATGDQKKELRKSLSEAVGKLFDLRHAAQAKQVEKLEAELTEAKELLKKRGERKDEIVERRIAELLQSADDLAWNREIGNQPRPATSYQPNYSVAPNAYPQTPLPYNSNNIYSVPSGTYPGGENPYNALPSPAPGTSGTYNSNPPPSSTLPQLLPKVESEPQLLPMIQSNATQSNSLPSAPSSIDTTSAYVAPSAATVSSAPSNPLSSTNSASTLSHLNAQPEEATATQPSTANSKLSSASIETSKTVIEAAYAYEEALQLATDEASLWKKGVTSSTAYSASKRKAAKAKAIWKAIGRDLETRLQILSQELSAKEKAITEYQSESKREEALLERTKLASELETLHETKAWAVDFEKQSLESLEKKLEKELEQSDKKNADTKSEEPKSDTPNPVK